MGLGCPVVTNGCTGNTMSFIDRLIPIDFEYNHSKDKKMNLVCCSLEYKGEIKEFWLHNGYGVFKEFISSLPTNSIFLAHNASAEARSFLSANLKPLAFKWIDNFAEHRMITNHCNEMMYGKQLIKGREVVTKPKEYGKDGKVENSKPEHSLSATVYKMLGVKIDTVEKDEVRDIIIRANREEIESNRDRIQKYCTSDIKYLKMVYLAHLKKFSTLIPDFDIKQFTKEQFLRGEAMVRTAIMEQVGYPIDFEATKNFSLQAPNILNDIARDVNAQFPEVKPFSYDFKNNRYKQNQKNIKKWIYGSKYAKDWSTTKTGFSLKKEEWEQRFGNGHIFERGNFGSQMYRYYYTKQHLNGFQSTTGKERTFWGSVGSDKMVRAWLNPYRSQSARFQPTATDFIPLKASWMRALIKPPKGKVIAAIDYKSEEFLVAALISGDDKMIEAYLTGDVYLAFAKSAGMVPEDATKHTHPVERQIAKAVVLSIQYGKTAKGLAVTLECSEREAQGYIDKFNKVYSKYFAWKTSLIGGVKTYGRGLQRNITGSYEEDGFIKLPCGWYMFGDNANMRSVANCPVQGFGSSILRKAIELCQDNGLDVIYPLHDAIYIMLQNDENLTKNLRLFKKCMRDAFVYYFEDKENAGRIGLDMEIWGFEEPTQVVVDDETTVQGETIHIDERSVDQYEEFKKYFKPDPMWSEL